MPSGVPICRLRALGRRTSASGCSSWPTPDAQAMNDGCDIEQHQKRLDAIKATGINGNGAGMTLGAAAQLTAWPTPDAHRHGDYMDDASLLKRLEDSRKSGAEKRQMNLQYTAQLTAWPTPRETDATSNVEMPEARQIREGRSDASNLPTAASLTAWATPRAEDAESAGMRHSRGQADTLSAQTGQDLAGWATPAARDAKGANGQDARSRGRPVEDQLANQAEHLAPWVTPSAFDAENANTPETWAARQERNANTGGKTAAKDLAVQIQLAPPASGTTTGSSSAGTARRGVLNPAFSAWLMGFPEEWLSCVVWETRSSRKPPRGSSGPSSKPRRPKTAPAGSEESLDGR